jgi:hypothetical protein
MMMNVKQAGARAFGHFSRKRLSRYKRDERGVFVILSLFFVIITFIAIGFAVDVARHEAMRVRLAATLDRAVLAAADLTNGLDPEDVVRDYFVKAGYNATDVTPVVTESDSGRKVVATAYKPVDTWFMKLVGVPTINAGAIGAAEQGVSKIEVSLVLDLSMSMTDAPADGSRAKVESLKIAARDFVDTVLLGGGNTTFISLIPYGSQVMLGNDVIKHFNTTAGIAGTQTSCVEWAASDYSSAGVPNAKVLNRTIIYGVGHTNATSPWNEANAPITTGAVGNNAKNNCPTQDIMKVVPYSTDADALKSVISSYTSSYTNTVAPWNYTSVDVAAKWGIAFLDPSLREEVTAMASDSSLTGNYDVPSAAGGHPHDYTYKQDGIDPADQTMKVMVLMTDGLNTYDWSTLAPDGTQSFYTRSNSMSFVYANSDWTKVDFRVFEGTRLSSGSSSSSGMGDATSPANEEWYHALCGGTGCADVAGVSPYMGVNRWTTNPIVPLLPVNATPNVNNMVRKTWPEVFARYRPQYIAYLIGKMMASNANNTNNNTSGTVRPAKNTIDPHTLKMVGSWPGNIAGNEGSVVQPVTVGILGWHPSDPVAERFDKLPYGFYTANYTFNKDARLQAICAAAKDPTKKIIIYTVGYDLNAPANANAKTQMTNCATTGKAFYPSGDNDIGSVFNQIANEIGKLRLTQ